MVQYMTAHLDASFAALSDVTRRGVLERLGRSDASITELADRFQRYNHEGGNIEAYYPKEIIILKLASDGFGGLLRIEDTVFFAHAA